MRPNFWQDGKLDTASMAIKWNNKALHEHSKKPRQSLIFQKSPAMLAAFENSSQRWNN